ncbi:MAG: helix-turn-helix transcriptional regulator [Acidobacteria bacterium]|nr:helix-turn-helix transcriptional regulator [Acidobacteriota bacterium]
MRAEKLLALWHSYRQKMQSARSSASLLTLIDELIKNPAITYGQAARVLDVTHRAAVMNIRKLIDAGILERVSERQRNQLFIAREIIAALESGFA